MGSTENIESTWPSFLKRSVFQCIEGQRLRHRSSQVRHDITNRVLIDVNRNVETISKLTESECTENLASNLLVAQVAELETILGVFVYGMLRNPAIRSESRDINCLHTLPKKEFRIVTDIPDKENAVVVASCAGLLAVTSLALGRHRDAYGLSEFCLSLDPINAAALYCRAVSRLLFYCWLASEDSRGTPNVYLCNLGRFPREIMAEAIYVELEGNYLVVLSRVLRLSIEDLKVTEVILSTEKAQVTHFAATLALLARFDQIKGRWSEGHVPRLLSGLLDIRSRLDGKRLSKKNSTPSDVREVEVESRSQSVEFRDDLATLLNSFRSEQNDEGFSAAEHPRLRQTSIAAEFNVSQATVPEPRFEKSIDSDDEDDDDLLPAKWNVAVEWALWASSFPSAIFMACSRAACHHFLRFTAALSATAQVRLREVLEILQDWFYDKNVVDGNDPERDSGTDLNEELSKFIKLCVKRIRERISASRNSLRFRHATESLVKNFEVMVHGRKERINYLLLESYHSPQKLINLLDWTLIIWSVMLSGLYILYYFMYGRFSAFDGFVDHASESGDSKLLQPIKTPWVFFRRMY